MYVCTYVPSYPGSGALEAVQGHSEAGLGSGSGWLGPSDFSEAGWGLPEVEFAVY